METNFGDWMLIVLMVFAFGIVITLIGYAGESIAQAIGGRRRPPSAPAPTPAAPAPTALEG